MKIIYIARYYPPVISGAARRLSGVVEGLRAAGADVFVVAPVLPDGEFGIAVPHPQAQPRAREDQISQTPVKDFIRRWARIPDSDVKWAKEAASATMASLPFEPDWIITSSPPESVFETGLRLKKSTGALWASDFRDHWLINPHYELRHSRLRQFIEKKWAKKLKGQLDIGFGVNEAIAAEFRSLLHSDVKILPHFALQAPIDKIELPADKVNFVHTGRFSLSDPNCDIRVLLNAFEKAHKMEPRICLYLIGDLSAEEKAAIRQNSSAHAIFCKGVLPMEEAIAYQAAADALLLVSASDAIAPPSKIVEYRAAAKPVIICGSDSWSDQSDEPYLRDADGFLAIANGQSPVQATFAPTLDHLSAGKSVFDALVAKQRSIETR